MEVELPANVGYYGRPTGQPTDQPTDRPGQRKVTLPTSDAPISIKDDAKCGISSHLILLPVFFCTCCLCNKL